jgi:hypothetical protein
MINQSIAELYNMIQDADPDYYLSSATETVVAGTDTYPLASFSTDASDLLKLRGVDYVESATVSVPLGKYNFAERHRRYDFATASNFPTDATASKYRLLGSNIVISPVPVWGGTIKIWYIPAAATLDEDTDTFDGIAGWEEWVVLDCCIKCLAKEESDASQFLDQKLRFEKRFQALAEDRDIGEPDTVRDTLKEALAYDGVY